jgi:hypothetical protein
MRLRDFGLQVKDEYCGGPGAALPMSVGGVEWGALDGQFS